MNTHLYVTGVPLPKSLRRVLYQINVNIENSEMPSSSCYESAKECIWLWLEKKTKDMPALSKMVAERNDSIDLLYNNSIHMKTAFIEDEGCIQWGMSFSHPDMSTPTQIWETQAVLTQCGEHVQLFTELSYSVAISGVDVEPSVPGFVRDIARNVGLTIEIPVSDTVWRINNEQGLDTLYNLLLNPNRNLPVVVLAQPDRKKWPIPNMRVPEYIIPAEQVAESCFGRCFVVELPYSMSFKWTKKIGRLWSVFDGGLRIYQPGLNLDEDDIYAHPLYSKTKILAWKQHGDEPSWKSFERQIINFLRSNPTLLISTQTRFSFSDLYQKKLLLMRQADSSSREALLNSYKSQLDDLKERAEYYEELSEEYLQKYQYCKQENSTLSSENHNLSILAETLRAALQAGGKSLEIPIPDDYDEMEEWCTQYLPDRLVFTTRARRAIKDTENLYSDVQLVYRCLLFLGQEYYDTKIGNCEGKLLQSKLDSLQIENRPSVTPSQAGQYEEEYYYTDSKGIKHLVDMHLTRGKGRDSRNTLRIYYYWDDEASKVVVVSLTKHLTTSDT